VNEPHTNMRESSNLDPALLPLHVLCKVVRSARLRQCCVNLRRPRISSWGPLR
jgi:hypothetical protein